MLLILALIVFVWFMIPQYQRPVKIPAVLTKDECAHIKRAALPRLQPSTVGGHHQVNMHVRQSETAWLGREDPVVRKLMDQCLKHVDRPVENCEKLQVLRYRPGGFYKPHYDCFKGGENPRMYTFIVALNDEYDGGATAFPNIKQEYRLNTGDCLLFENLDNYEFMTSKAWHGGKPVSRGEKWVCNLWVHKHPYKG
jgi:predicted 2-oxoglutarate/Fe(II)-dependent dioxygenase YbiX